MDLRHVQLLDLFQQQELLRASDLDAIGAPRVVLSRLTASGQLERVGRGLYRLPSGAISEHESLATVAVKVPQAVFCLLTALQFHELTTQLPRQVWIAMPRGSHTPRIDYPPVKMVQMANLGLLDRRVYKVYRGRPGRLVQTLYYEELLQPLMICH